MYKMFKLMPSSPGCRLQENLCSILIGLNAVSIHVACLVPNELRYVDQCCFLLPLSGTDMLVLGDYSTLANYWWSSDAMFMLGRSIFFTWVDPKLYICSMNLTSMLGEKMS